MCCSQSEWIVKWKLSRKILKKLINFHQRKKLWKTSTQKKRRDDSFMQICALKWTWELDKTCFVTSDWALVEHITFEQKSPLTLKQTSMLSVCSLREFLESAALSLINQKWFEIRKNRNKEKHSEKSIVTVVCQVVESNHKQRHS